MKSLEIGTVMNNVAIRNACGESSSELDDMIVSAEQTLLQLTAKLKSDEGIDEQYSGDQLRLHKVVVFHS